MRHFGRLHALCLPIYVSCFVVSGAAQNITLSGVVLDRMCYAEKHPHTLEEALKHPRVCLMSERCSGSGYGLFTDDNRFLAFDASGNKRAAEFIRLFRGSARVTTVIVGLLRGPFLENITLTQPITGWTGWIADSFCANKGVARSEHHAMCAKKCIQGGSDAVFVTDDGATIAGISDQAAIVEYAGHHIEVQGSLSIGERTVVKIGKVKLGL